MNRHMPMIFVLGAGLAVSLFACGDDDETDPGPQGGGTTTSSSTTSSTTSSATSSTTSSTTSAGGSGGSITCEDTGPGEPNDAPEDAEALAGMSDDDPDPLPTFEGVLNGPSDVDWYSYAGSDELLAYVDPERTYTAGGDVQMCAFFWCTSTQAFGPPEMGGEGGAGGGGAYTCPPGTSFQEADLSAVTYGSENLGTAPGCCTEPGTDTFHLGEDLLNDYWVPFGCPDWLQDDSMMVMIRMSSHDGAPADTCTSYVVEYHF